MSYRSAEKTIEEEMIRLGPSRSVYRSLDGSVGENYLSCGILFDKNGSTSNRKDILNQKELNFILILQGEGIYRDNILGEIKICQGDYVLRLPGRVHRISYKPGQVWQEAYVSLPPRFADAANSMNIYSSDKPVIKNDLTTANIYNFRRIIEELECCPDKELSQMAVRFQEYINRITLLSRSSTKPYDKSLNKAADILRDSSLPLERVASEVGLSYETFRKRFKEKKGISPSSFRRRYLIEKSCSLLLDRGKTIKEIAFELGYGDVYSFSKQFKSQTGISPAIFRKMR